MSLPTDARCVRSLTLSALVALIVLQATSAHAHAVGLSRGEYRVDGSRLRAELAFARPDIESAVPALDVDRDGSLSVEEVAAGGPVLGATIIRKLDVRGQAGPCKGSLEHAALIEQDGLAIRASFECGVAGPLSVRAGLLDSLPLGHRHLAAIIEPDGRVERVVLYEAQPEFQAGGVGTTASTGITVALFRLGIEHILTGYDHLVFLLGLILVGGRIRSLLVVVTAFTLAHSVTLALAALGVWAPSPSMIEPAIALSIAYVGVENWFVRDAERRWLITFPFGLVHGFGFAGALHEVAVPQGQIPLALVSFNVGVEAGQVAVLLVVLPAVLWLRRQTWFALGGVRAASAAIAAAGVAWFVSRVTL